MDYTTVKLLKRIAIENYGLTYSVDIPSYFVDKSDPKFNKLTGIAKIIIVEQMNMVFKDCKDNNGEKCTSCKIRKINPNEAYPCHHFLRKV